MGGCWSFKGCSQCYSFFSPQKRCEKYLCSHSPGHLVEKRSHHVSHSRCQMHICGCYGMGQACLWSSCVFTHQRGIPAQGSTCAVALVGTGQPLLYLHPHSQSFHQERQPGWTSTQFAFGKSMLTISIIFWSLKCLAKMMLSTSTFFILSVITLFSFPLISFSLHQISPLFLKVAHLRNYFLFSFTTLVSLSSNQSAFWFCH